MTYYIVRWVLVLFVTVNDCEIRGITNHQAVFTDKGKCDSFALALKTNKPEANYGDYTDSIQTETSLIVPIFYGYIKKDTVCK